ncbi:YraN family protein [Roseovarius sp. MMSF_3281]|uniref:YraN family protein n=1 Tax=Roseovarius sp. MMSF_3281 TaxID=3046694 RepID=UPI00273F114E|nr:YraN family protein [Roseovarius sp. MMSF_3281]
MKTEGAADSTSKRTRKLRGQAAYLSGVAAEKNVARAYERLGARILDERWRGQGGEIDMILQDGPEIVFCEVKKAKCFDEAIARLRPNQIQRIRNSAAEYLGRLSSGQLTEVRFDLAVVDGNGQAQIIKNAFGHF